MGDKERVKQRTQWKKQRVELRDNYQELLKKQWDKALKEAVKDGKTLARRSRYVDPKLRGRLSLPLTLKAVGLERDEEAFDLFQTFPADDCCCDGSQKIQMRDMSTSKLAIRVPCFSLRKVAIELPTIEYAGEPLDVDNWKATLRANADGLDTGPHEIWFEFEGNQAHPEWTLIDGPGGVLCGSCQDWMLHISYKVEGIELPDLNLLVTQHTDFSSVACPGIVPPPPPPPGLPDPPHAIQDIPVTVIVADSAGKKAMLLFKFVVKSWC